MLMDASSGFLLTGIRVFNEGVDNIDDDDDDDDDKDSSATNETTSTTTTSAKRAREEDEEGKDDSNKHTSKRTKIDDGPVGVSDGDNNVTRSK